MHSRTLRLRRFGPAPGVGDLVGAAATTAVCSALVEVGVARGVRLDEQDLAALADGVRGLDVERDLDAPSFRFFGFFDFARRCLRAASAVRALVGNGRLPASPSWLTCLKQPLRRRAFRQPEFFVVGFQVGFGGRVVVGVDDARSSARRRAVRELVGAVQVLRAQAEVAGRRRARSRRCPPPRASAGGVRAGLRGLRDELAAPGRRPVRAPAAGRRRERCSPRAPAVRAPGPPRRACRAPRQAAAVAAGTSAAIASQSDPHGVAASPRSVSAPLASGLSHRRAAARLCARHEIVTRWSRERHLPKGDCRHAHCGSVRRD